MGSTTSAALKPLWLPSSSASVAHTLKASSDTASSSATTCSTVSTNSPLALYWRMVISVEAGAVAEAIAPSSSEKGTSRWNMKIMASVTATAATSASMTVRMMIFEPLLLIVSHLKYLPVPKAISASAASVRKDIPFTMSFGIRPVT